MAQETDLDRDEVRRTLAETGIRLQIRPAVADSVAARLFALDAELTRRATALDRFIAVVAGTDPGLLTADDARLFRRERDRRRRATERLAKERADLLARYARELLDAGSHHPEMAPLLEKLVTPVG